MRKPQILLFGEDAPDIRHTLTGSESLCALFEDLEFSELPQSARPFLMIAGERLSVQDRITTLIGDCKGDLQIQADPIPQSLGFQETVLAGHRKRSHGFDRFSIDHFIEEGMAETTFALMETCRGIGQFVVVIDLNVLEATGLGQGVTKQAPGGLSPAELLFLVRKVLLLKTVTGVIVTGFDLKMDRAGFVKGILPELVLAILSSAEEKLIREK